MRRRALAFAPGPSPSLPSSTPATCCRGARRSLARGALDPRSRPGRARRLRLRRAACGVRRSRAMRVAWLDGPPVARRGGDIPPPIRRHDHDHDVAPQVEIRLLVAGTGWPPFSTCSGLGRQGQEPPLSPPRSAGRGPNQGRGRPCAGPPAGLGSSFASGDLVPSRRRCSHSEKTGQRLGKP